MATTTTTPVRAIIAPPEQERLDQLSEQGRLRQTLDALRQASQTHRLSERENLAAHALLIVYHEARFSITAEDQLRKLSAAGVLDLVARCAEDAAVQSIADAHTFYRRTLHQAAGYTTDANGWVIYPHQLGAKEQAK